MTRDEKKELLDFWTLCEIADFERFKKSKFSVFQPRSQAGIKTIESEYENFYYAPNKHRKKVYIDNKTSTIRKVYIGIIKSDDAIKFIYKKLKERNLLPHDTIKNSDEDIEKLPFSPDFTYMAYIYLDDDDYMISVSGKSLVINPLFYILKNLLEKSLVNTIAYTEFSDSTSNIFSEEYGIKQKSEAFIIPDLEYMLKSGHFLTYLKNCTIGILDELEKDTKALAENERSAQNQAKKLLALLKQERNNENSNFKFGNTSKINPTIDNIYFKAACQVAKRDYYKYTYLLTKNELDFNGTIPKNLFLIKFINNEKILHPSLIYGDKVNSKKIADIFRQCCQNLYLADADIFYTESDQSLSIFTQQKDYNDLTFIEINNIEEKKHLSYYINALDEEPAKLSIPYIDGVEEKIDINDSTEIKKKYNDIQYFKQVNSRWVSNYNLNYAQQTAVNQFLSKLNKNNNNIFSINGPPGTGKTTLLKDVIAEIVTRRVSHCIDLAGNLFDNNGLKSELLGKYEIIVTSNNNAAVENITLELPKMEDFHLDYIGYKENDFLLSKFATDFYGCSSWNLISINLGNSTNIKSFRDKFADFKKNIEEDGILKEQTRLNDLKDEYVRKIANCKKRISVQENIFSELPKISLYHDTLKSYALKKRELKNEVENITTEITYKNKKDNAYIEDSQKNSSYINRSREIISLKEFEKSEYNFFRKVFSYSSYKEIKNILSSEKKALSTQLLKQQEQELEKEANKKRLLEKQELRVILEKDLYGIQHEFEKLEKVYKVLKQEQAKGYSINNESFYQQNEQSLQKSSLYNEEGYLRDKALLFALSMQLSEIYFLQNFDKFCSCIDTFLDTHKKILTKKDKVALQKNFTAFSFVLPVISTSLAASYLMFKNINSFGTLLCDESGQATPQSLIGLLNRANNALIVGDPLQVEPVFTAPSILINLIKEMYKVEEKYSPISSSVQAVADESNSLGSNYEVKGKKLWVGMPLVVHRRCVEPMFSISNRISYNDKMVLATPAIKNDDLINALPNSCWIDVQSNEEDFGNGNTSLMEIEALDNFLKKHSNYLQNNYYIISPFKDIYKHKGIANDEKNLGTVHTFQGKEQDVIFFILGGNVKRAGAKDWVSSKANILNVATTRARKRIYFIGDYDLWKGHEYFKTVINLIKKKV